MESGAEFHGWSARIKGLPAWAPISVGECATELYPGILFNHCSDFDYSHERNQASSDFAGPRRTQCKGAGSIAHTRVIGRERRK